MRRAEPVRLPEGGHLTAEAVSRDEPVDLDAFFAMLERPPWMAEAACRGKPQEWWYPENKGYEVYANGRPICAGCSVAFECADAGRNEQWGMWAASTPAERREARRGRPAA